MFGGAGPALGYLLGLTSPGELMYGGAMHRQVAGRQASEELAQIKACMLPKAILYDKKKDGAAGRYNDTFKWKELSFKEKLQEETDEWLDKVLD